MHYTILDENALAKSKELFDLFIAEGVYEKASVYTFRTRKRFCGAWELRIYVKHLKDWLALIAFTLFQVCRDNGLCAVKGKNPFSKFCKKERIPSCATAKLEKVLYVAHFTIYERSKLGGMRQAFYFERLCVELFPILIV